MLHHTPATQQLTFASCCCRAAAVLLVRPLQTATSGCGAHLLEDVGMGLMKRSLCMVATSSIKTATLICHSCLSHTLEGLQHPSLQVPYKLPNVAHCVLAGLIDIRMHIWLCSCKQMMCGSIRQATPGIYTSFAAKCNCNYKSVVVLLFHYVNSSVFDA